MRKFRDGVLFQLSVLIVSCAAQLDTKISPDHPLLHLPPLPGDPPGIPAHPPGLPAHPPGLPAHPPGLPAHPPGVPAKVKKSECKSLMDMCIVIDGSDSINKINFDKIRAAVKSMMGELKIGPTLARVGFLVYSTTLGDVVPMSGDRIDLEGKALTLGHPRDGTNTWLGIEKMRELFRNGARKNVPKIGIVITDGISKDVKLTVEQANFAKKEGVSMFAVGVGRLIDKDELLGIASSKEQMVLMDSFKELGSKLKFMMKTVCPCPIPPEVLNAVLPDGSRAIGSVRRYVCDKGYIASSDPVIKCQKDSTWTPIDFECIDCGTPPEIPLTIYSKNYETAIGSLVQYKCIDTYVTVGKGVSICTKDATWSVPEITCEPCLPPQKIENTILSAGDNLVGTRRFYTCHEGYLLEGNNEIVCQTDGHWSPIKFKCSVCGKLPHVDLALPIKVSHLIGARVEYQCETGYHPSGPPFAECDKNAQWILNKFHCQLCPIPMKVPNAIIDPLPDGVTIDLVGSTRTYTCKDRFIPEGPIESTCEALGYLVEWRPPKFNCVGCVPPPYIDELSTLYDKNPPPPYLVGDEVKYECLAGYVPTERPTLTCQKDGHWTKPTFTCITCKPPPTFPNADLEDRGNNMVGSIRRYICKHGYVETGPIETVCTDLAIWEEPVHRCRGCPAILPPAENADPAPMVEDPATIDWLVGSIRKYECHKGFTFTAPPQVKCMGNGEWSFPEFQCISCKFPAPIVQNAQILGKYTTTIGSTVLYKCDDKYVESGTITRICQENAEWSHPTHSCGGCIEPMTITHATYSAGGYLVGDTRIYTCDKRYAPSGLDTIVCQKDGLWSKTDFMCSTCSKPPKIDLATTDYKGELFVGTEIVYQCKPGYLAQGKSTALRCLKDGTWSPAEFSCIACGIPQPIPLTYLNIPPNVDHFLIGSRLNYYCHDEFSAVGYTEIVCMPDATWSMPDFKCINCGPPPPVMNATFPMVPALVGTVLSYTCEKEYIADGPTDIMCHEDGQWDIPKFKCITCGFPPIAQNTYPPEGPTTIGSVLYYTCRKGYTSKDKIWTECGKDGHWTPASGGCYACQKPPKIDHAYLLDFKDGPEAGKHIGVTRKYKCDTGYAAVGTTEIFCGGDGMWTPIDLKCITCKPPPKLEFAVPQKGPRYIGTVLEYPCLPGYVSNIPVSIECLGDGTWSPSTDVCRPCDPPKEILYGKVQPITPDDIYRRVGSRWTYVCNAGYKFVGKNQEITCNSDATWTDMYGECKIDCGEIPFVPNTILPFGPTTAGTVFEYGCKEGYVSVNPIKIECLANGTWTRPLDKCRDCGDPKSVLNAVYTTNNGNLVGSVTVFTCKKGFKASGSTEIKCGPNGQWSKPVFTCSAILPVKKDPSVCDECRMMNGVGYNNHPFDCTQFVQCYFGTGGSLEPIYRRCTFGQYWNQRRLTCERSKDVICPHEKCRNPRVRHYKHTDPNKCCAYWECENGKSVAKCCPNGQSYHPLYGCRDDPKCVDKCPHEDRTPACDKRPLFNNVAKYEQHLGNDYWVSMPCAPGTVFNAATCDCSITGGVVPDFRCKPELHLPFDQDFSDKSGKRTPVINEGVSISGRAAFFDGKSRLLINRFANVEFHGDLVIKLRYKEVLAGPTRFRLQSLVSNGDCGSDPSIVIAKMPGYVLLGTKTDSPRSFALPTVDKEWKEVIFIHDRKRLEGKVCGAAYDKWSWGHIRSTHCGLQIGYGQGLSNFIGYIDDLTIYTCRPHKRILDINYG